MLALLDEILKSSETHFIENKTQSGEDAIFGIKEHGFYIKQEGGEQARPVFVGLQAVAERAGVNALVTQNRALSHQVKTEKEMVDALASKKGIKSVWIIHTPVIATPCVTEGQTTEGLLAKEIEQNEKLKALTLSRASIIRDYLEQGGKLIIAYNQDQPGRTSEQIAIYEKLKTKYAKQIVDFSMALGKDKYPEDFIGATYLMEDPEGNWFEMTNRGVQANAPKEAEWGIWVQDSKKRMETVGARMKHIINFLADQKMGEALEKAGVDKDAFSPLQRYMKLELKNESSKKMKVTM